MKLFAILALLLTGCSTSWTVGPNGGLIPTLGIDDRAVYGAEKALVDQVARKPTPMSLHPYPRAKAVQNDFNWLAFFEAAAEVRRGKL